MEFVIDLLGRSRNIGKRNVALAVTKVGYVHFRLVANPLVNRSEACRTAIVTLQPRLLTQPALAALGYKLADLDPERTIVVAELAVPRCWVFAGHMPALALIATLASDGGGTQTVQAVDRRERPM